MKYILPIVNCIVICTLSVIVNVRDMTPIIGAIIAVAVIAFTVYHIRLIKNNGNKIKINSLNKMVTLLSVVLLAGCIYEFATGNTISDRTGDIMALAVGAIGIVMWVYDYYIKPFRKSK